MDRSSEVQRQPSQQHSDGAVTADDTTAAVPEAGHLLWMPPEGDLREVRLESLLGESTAPTGEDGPSECPACAYPRSVETVVREHPACGHVSLNGFVAGNKSSQYSCPKCASTIHDPLPIVAVVHCCLRCGQVLGVPLSGDGR